jgi:hypothetical protein
VGLTSTPYVVPYCHIKTLLPLSSLSANEVGEIILRPREREKVPEGRMRVVGVKTNPEVGERWRI